MAYSVYTAVATGSTNIFAFSFSGRDDGYLQEDDIKVYVGDEVDPRDFTLITANSLEVSGDLIAASTVVSIRRVTDKDQSAVDFQDQSFLKADDLDLAVRQVLYTLHEVLDGYGLTSVQTDINMNGHKLINPYSDPNDDDSIATVGFISGSLAGAEAAQDAAEAARDKAQLCAEEDEDVEVEAGAYSALHHKEKALAAQTAADASAAAAASYESDAYDAAVAADASYNALVALGDSFMQPRTIIDTEDWDTVQSMGVYKVANPTGANSPAVAGYLYGTLVVHHVNTYVTQTYVSGGRVWCRLFDETATGVEWKEQANLSLANEWHGVQTYPQAYLATSGAATWDTAAHPYIGGTLTGDVTITPTNMVNRGFYAMYLDTAGYEVSWDSAFAFDRGVAPDTPSGKAYFVFVSNGAEMRGGIFWEES